MKRSLIVLAATFPLVAVSGLYAQNTDATNSDVTPVAASTGAGLHHACYVPATGTIYMIRTEGTAQSCLSGQHVAVSWNVQGVEGPAGAAGVPGEAGHAGADGADGLNGAQGDQGPTGLQGADGADGLTGAQGDQGPTGLQGADGADGLKGAEGDQGPAGLQGADGADGADGVNGAQGLKGEPGDGLEFIWNGTQLGVRRVGDVSYSYQDLQGADGPAGGSGGGPTILAANATLPGAGTFVISGDNLMPASPVTGTLVAVIAYSSSTRITVNGGFSHVYQDLLRQWIWNGSHWLTVYSY
jgi:hypothetical protein